MIVNDVLSECQVGEAFGQKKARDNGGLSKEIEGNRADVYMP